MLIQPSKCICTTNKKTKNLKPKSKSKGPFNISLNTEWDAFLGIIAKKISLEPSQLLISSFEWHWLKPTHGFLSRMKMDSHQCSERSTQRANHISSFICRYWSKIRHWMPLMNTSLILRITQFQRKYACILCFRPIVFTSCRQSWRMILKISMSISATSTP